MTVGKYSEKSRTNRKMSNKSTKKQKWKQKSTMVVGKYIYSEKVGPNQGCTTQQLKNQSKTINEHKKRRIKLQNNK
jgi:hypothetical protein